MTPDEDYDTRRIDGLLKSFGELTKAEAVLAERVATQDRGLLELRDSQREAIRDLRLMVQAIGEACEGHTKRVEDKIDAQARAVQANKWSPTQWAAILGPTLTALIGAAALILTGGPK